MGRRKIDDEKKKTKLSISINENNFKKLETYNINKSKFINWLLINYYINEIIK